MSVELQGFRMAEHRELAPRTPWQVQLLSRQFPRLTGRAPKWLPDVDSHHDDPLNRRTCYFDIIRELPAPGLAPGTSAVRSGACRISYTLRVFVIVVGHLGYAPSISPSQAARIAIFLVPEKYGGLCGHCSRDLPLDRRLLFVAELTGQMVGCVGNAPTRPLRATALQAARDLYAANNPEMVAGRGVAPR